MKQSRTQNIELGISILMAVFFLLSVGSGCSRQNSEPGTQNSDPAQVGIEEVFVDNYPEKADSVQVSISESEGDLLKGAVSMDGVSNHVFYAAKVDGEWDVVYDPEQRQYECDLLRGYGFSEAIIEGCEEPEAEFTVGDAKGIQMAFADIYHKNVEDINIRVSQRTAKHARGSVQFAGEQGGGMFLAVKDQGIWDIVVDGHGAYECKFVEPYDFPEEMVHDCYQDSN
ncbi:hypothetical protein GF391_03585 [Candidatus Uhrbacteria bacterium]|nr:hypothetical protein [Candidatus Uhrbacteria bacterium]